MKLNKTFIELSRDEWFAYFTGLSKLYLGWWVTIEMLDREFGDPRLAQSLPLQGISFEIEGSEAGDLLIEMGDTPMTYMVHHVDKPRIVRVAETKPGAETAVQIESEGGTTTLVHLYQPEALPPAKSEQPQQQPAKKAPQQQQGQGRK